MTKFTRETLSDMLMELLNGHVEACENADMPHCSAADVDPIEFEEIEFSPTNKVVAFVDVTDGDKKRRFVVAVNEIRIPKFDQPIPDYGDLMTVEAFNEACEETMFTDYDGHGYPSDGKMMDREVVVEPSSRAIMLPGATHVVWFNK